MPIRNGALVRISLSILSGIALWLMWRAWKVTPPEVESVKMLSSITEVLFGAQSIAGKYYTILDDWRGLLPLSVLFCLVFSALKPLPRFVALIIFALGGAAVGLYYFYAVKFIVPVGGPAIILTCAYLCGTVIHLETEKIQRNRQLAFDLQQQAEHERKRIAKELHDASLSSLSKVMRMADRLKEQYPESQIPTEIRASLEISIAEMRRVINDLHPAILEEYGLAIALEHLVEDFRKHTSIQASYADSGTLIELPEFHQLCMYRIVQEALANVQKHANASHVEVRLEQSSTGTVLTVADNGNGGAQKKPGSFGMHNIEQRAKLLGGSIEWRAPAQFPSGTMLIVHLPAAPKSMPKAISQEADRCLS